MAKILQGDRCKHFGGGEGTIAAIKKGLLKYEIHWDNGKVEHYSTKEFSKWCEHLPPEPEAEDIEEEEAQLWEQCGDNDPLDFSREEWKIGDRCLFLGRSSGQITEVKEGMARVRFDESPNLDGKGAWTDTKWLQPEWKVGDRVRVTNPNTPKSVTAHEWIVDGFTTASSLTGELNLIIIKREVEPKGFTTRTFEAQWLCKVSEPVDSSRDKEDSPEQLSLLGGLTGKSPSRMTKMRLQSLSQISNTKSLGQTYENFTPAQASMTSLLVDSPALIPVEPETELELLTYLRNQEQCSVSSSDALEKSNQNLSFWSNLPDLSIEDLEHGLEDSEWADIKASIQSSRQQINLERSLRGNDYLSFHTLLSGRGRGCRDAGLVECEKWWKQSGIVPLGYQLSAPAIALLHGFPSNWYREISPRYQSPIDIQADSQPESLEAKPSPSLRPESPSNGSSGSGQSLTNSGLVISFGKTYPELLNGKSVTRRLWKFSHAKKFIRAYQKGLKVQALNKDQRYGGKQVGWLTLLEEPYEQLLSQMPLEDLAAEGFPELTLTEFCERFFEGNLELTPWVIRFKFEPLEAERALEQPNNSLEKCPGCEQPLLKLEDGCGVCGWLPEVKIPVRPITGSSPNSCPVSSSADSLEKSSRQTGCLTQYAPSKKGVRYPKIEGHRDKFNDTHWYWNYGWKEQDPDSKQWVSRSVPVKLCHLAEVRRAIADEKPYIYILREILGKI